jgi:hypothetical protein
MNQELITRAGGAATAHGLKLAAWGLSLSCDEVATWVGGIGRLSLVSSYLNLNLDLRLVKARHGGAAGEGSFPRPLLDLAVSR